MDIVSQLLLRPYEWDYNALAITHNIHENVIPIIAELQQIQHEKELEKLEIHDRVYKIATSLYIDEAFMLQYIEEFKRNPQALQHASLRVNWRFLYEHFGFNSYACHGITKQIDDLKLLESNITRWSTTIYDNPHITIEFIEKYGRILDDGYKLCHTPQLTKEYVMARPDIIWNYDVIYDRFGYFDADYLRTHIHLMNCGIPMPQPIQYIEKNNIAHNRHFQIYWQSVLSIRVIPYELFIEHMDKLDEIYTFIRRSRPDLGPKLAIYMDSINHKEAPYVCGEYGELDMVEKYIHICGAWTIEQNTNLTFQFILEHPDIKWNYNVLHKIIPLEYIDAHPELNWNYYDISRHCVLTEEFIEKYNLNPALIAQNPNITLDIIDKYLTGYIDKVCMNPLTREKMLRKLIE
jgi:hypothetical protein